MTSFGKKKISVNWGVYKTLGAKIRQLMKEIHLRCFTFDKGLKGYPKSAMEIFLIKLYLYKWVGGVCKRYKDIF